MIYSEEIREKSTNPWSGNKTHIAAAYRDRRGFEINNAFVNLHKG